MNLKQDMTNSTSKQFKLTNESQKKLVKKIKMIQNIVENKKDKDGKGAVEKHSFYPFIGFDIIERRGGTINKIKYYEKKLFELAGDDKEKCQKKLDKLKSDGLNKGRPIRYAAHFDGYIYAHYAKKLYIDYEIKLNKLGLSDEVLAYRALPPIYIDDKELKPNNCTMAKGIFDEIKRRDCNCIALAFDISSFYDNIDHANLKREWAALLDEEKLPMDHYNIFKSLTNYTFVDLKEICFYFNKKDKSPYCSLECCKRCKKKLTQQLPQRLFKNARKFREFRKWYKDKFDITFHKNEGANKDKPYGIPQGTAMSALLSNIYMIPFDETMKKLAGSIDGVYRRYCDDIMFICPPSIENKELVIKEIQRAIEERGKYLKIHPIEDWDKYSKSQCYDFTSLEEIKKQPLQYLGFLFDGESVRIREGSLARYMRKSKRAVTAAKENSITKLRNMHKKGLKIEEKHKKLYRRTLYSRYTHLGERNFISYAYRAFNDFDDTTIKKQVKNHFKRLSKIIKKADYQISETCDELIHNTQR